MAMPPPWLVNFGRASLFERIAARITSLGALVLASAFPLPAATWTEIDDAGNTPDTAQLTMGSGGLESIVGNLTDPDPMPEVFDNEDVYLINITDPRGFSASTLNDATAFDCELMLFDADGLGIYHHDDVSDEAGVAGVDFNRALLPVDDPLYGPESSGLYLLAIAIADNDAVSDFGLIFPNGDWDNVHGPDGAGGEFPLVGWDEGVDNIDESAGAYQIDLTGATFAMTGNALEAGDADQDLDFDQLDLVKVQIAAKYLTGQPATWGEGDWNGAPGGEPGSPPLGNGLFDQLDIIAALSAGKYLTGPYAALAAGGVTGDGQTSIGYDPSTGEVWVDAPAGTDLTSINIDSAAAVFSGEPAQNLGGSFDNDADDNIFKATFGSSFGSLSFGNVAQAGLSESFLAADLSVVGSLAGGGDLGNVDLIYIPEPSTIALLAIGLLFCLGQGIARTKAPCVRP